MGIKSVKFRGRHVSVRALVFLITGSLAIAAFLVLAILAAVGNGAGTWFGAVGMAAAIISLVGLIVSVKAVGERDVFVSVPIAGMIVNGTAFLLYVIIYIIGLV